MSSEHISITLDEEQHRGAVTSRTHPTGLVQEPITVQIEGQATELCLEDAIALHAGLAEAIARVRLAHDEVAARMGERGHCFVIGKTGNGMSLPRCKLGTGSSYYVNGKLWDHAAPSQQGAQP